MPSACHCGRPKAEANPNRLWGVEAQSPLERRIRKVQCRSYMVSTVWMCKIHV